MIPLSDGSYRDNPNITLQPKIWPQIDPPRQNRWARAISLP